MHSDLGFFPEANQDNGSLTNVWYQIIWKQMTVWNILFDDEMIRKDRILKNCVENS